MGGTIEARYGVEYLNQKNELYLKICLLSHAVGEVCGGKHIQGSLGTEPTLLDLKAIFMGKQIQRVDRNVCKVLYSIFILLYLSTK